MTSAAASSCVMRDVALERVAAAPASIAASAARTPASSVVGAPGDVDRRRRR